MSASSPRDRSVEIFEHKSIAGSNEVLMQYLADDARWTIAGSGCMSRTYAGKADLVDHCLAPLGERLEGAVRCRVEHIHATDDVVVVRWRGEARTKWGEPYQNDYCWILRWSDDRIVEVVAYIDTLLLEQVMTHPV